MDPADDAQRARLSVKPATLPTIFEVFLKTRAKLDTPAPAASSSSETPAAKTPTSEDKAAAESFKAKGNTFMSAKNYTEAIDAYTKAIDLDPTNVVFYSNRAAAHASLDNYTDAIIDAQEAIKLDPKFVRAYHRLGSVQCCRTVLCRYLTCDLKVMLIIR